jgi:dipeptide/tripeptide permease
MCAANETFEKAASFGVAANLTTYLVKRFNVGQLQATNVTNIFFATLNFTPLLGAFISDSYLGRFKTLACGCFATLLVCPPAHATPPLRPHSFPRDQFRSEWINTTRKS